MSKRNVYFYVDDKHCAMGINDALQVALQSGVSTFLVESLDYSKPLSVRPRFDLLSEKRERCFACKKPCIEGNSSAGGFVCRKCILQKYFEETTSQRRIKNKDMFAIN